jgi:hypothetical protein
MRRPFGGWCVFGQRGAIDVYDLGAETPADLHRSIPDGVAGADHDERFTGLQRGIFGNAEPGRREVDPDRRPCVWLSVHIFFAARSQLPLRRHFQP